MSVSPADFELYSRVTGTPYPRTAAEQMQLAPHVHNFMRNRGYQGPVQQTAQGLNNVLSGVRNIGLLGALAGAGALAYANREKKVDGGDDGGGGAAVPGPQNDLSGGGSGLPQGPYQAPNPAATFQDYQDLRYQPGGPITRQGGDIEEVNVQVDPEPSGNPLLRAVDNSIHNANVQNQILGGADPAQLPPGAPGGAIVSTPSPQIQPYESTAHDLADYGGRMGGVNLQNPFKTGRLVGVDSHLVDERENKYNPFSKVVASKVYTPKAVFTGDRDVDLGIFAPRRERMRNLPGTLANIAKSPGRVQVPWTEAAESGMEHVPHIPHSVGEAAGELVNSGADIANLGLDAIAPWAGGAAHLVRFAGQNPGIMAANAINLGEKAARMGLATGAAIGEQAVGDIVDFGRIAARPARAGFRYAIDAAPGALAKARSDIDVTRNVVPKLFATAAERGGDDYQRGVIKPAIEYMGERASADVDAVRDVVPKLFAKAAGAISNLRDHPQEADVPGGENKLAPSRDLEEYDDRYPRNSENDLEDPWS